MAMIKCPECGKEISDMAEACPNCGFPINKRKTKKKHSVRKTIITILLLLILAGLGTYGYFEVDKYIIQPRNAYAYAESLLASEQYDEAYESFCALADYEDSVNRAYECLYLKAKAFLNNKQYMAAKAVFESIGTYSDAQDMAKECVYQMACEMLEGPIYKVTFSVRNQAFEYLDGLGDYSDSKVILLQKKYELAIRRKTEKNYDSARTLFLELGGYKDSYDQYVSCYTSEVATAQQKKRPKEALGIYFEMVEAGIPEAEEKLISYIQTQLDNAISEEHIGDITYYRQMMAKAGKEGAEEEFKEYCEQLYMEAQDDYVNENFYDAKVKLNSLVSVEYTNAREVYDEVVAAEKVYDEAKKAAEAEAKAKADAKAKKEAEAKAKADAKAKKEAEAKAKKAKEEQAILEVLIAPYVDVVWEKVEGSFKGTFYKIDSKGLLHRATQYSIEKSTETGGSMWSTGFIQLTYDSDSGELKFQEFDEKFTVYLSENIMVIVCTNWSKETLYSGTYSKVY